MAPITTASNEETHAALLDQLDMQKVPKPFRNPDWKPPQRRNKNLKQILAEQQRAQQSSINTQQNSGASTPLPPTDGTTTPSLNPNPAQASQDLSRAVLEKNAKQSNGVAGTIPAPAGPSAGPSVTYMSIQAAPSKKPRKKYCDITGMPAKYTDPTTGLYYFNAEIFKTIKTLSPTQVQEYLALRGANTTELDGHKHKKQKPLTREDREKQRLAAVAGHTGTLTGPPEHHKRLGNALKKSYAEVSEGEGLDEEDGGDGEGTDHE